MINKRLHDFDPIKREMILVFFFHFFLRFSSSHFFHSLRCEIFAACEIINLCAIDRTHSLHACSECAKNCSFKSQAPRTDFGCGRTGIEINAIALMRRQNSRIYSNFIHIQNNCNLLKLSKLKNDTKYFVYISIDLICLS